MAALDVFRDIAPEFVTTDDATVTRWIGYAQLEINPASFGAKTDMATARLAAHQLTVSQRGATGQGGVTSMMKSAQMEEQYKIPGLRKSEEQYATTIHGLEFIRLRRTCQGAIGFRLL